MWLHIVGIFLRLCSLGVVLSRLFPMLMVVNSYCNRPQYPLAGLADGCSENPDDSLGVEVWDVLEILIFQELPRVKAASGKEKV